MASATPVRSSAATAIRMTDSVFAARQPGAARLVPLPAREATVRELLDAWRVIREAARQAGLDLAGELRLRRLGGIGVVNDLLDHPPHPLGEPVEVAVERLESGQLHELLHELVLVRLLGSGALPLA